MAFTSLTPYKTTCERAKLLDPKTLRIAKKSIDRRGDHAKEINEDDLYAKPFLHHSLFFSHTTYNLTKEET